MVKETSMSRAVEADVEGIMLSDDHVFVNARNFHYYAKKQFDGWGSLPIFLDEVEKRGFGRRVNKAPYFGLWLTDIDGYFEWVQNNFQDTKNNA